MRSKVTLDLEQVAQDHTKRYQEADRLEEEGLWYLMKIWIELADENVGNGNAYMYDYYPTQVSLYQ